MTEKQLLDGMVEAVASRVDPDHAQVVRADRIRIRIY
jgi:hypothetical protein